MTNTFLQKSFNNGLDLISADIQVAEDGYVWLINGRCRFGRVEPINKPVAVTGFPEDDIQGNITVGNVYFVFVSGKAYYRVDGTEEFIQVANFQMSTSAPRLWSQAVPASTKHFVRKLDVGLSVTQAMRETIDFKVAGTPAGIVVQDGRTQPWIIEWDSTNNFFVARLTKTYSQWTNNSTALNSREYVPIGTQMMFLNQKLFVVSRNRKEIYHSITGRPLDFMVNVDVNGNKLANEALGGVESVSFAFDFDDITCIKEINVTDSFIYATALNTRIITLDYSKTVFGEPTYTQSARIAAGIVNEECLVELNDGDIAFIAPDGVKSFNAVAAVQTKANGDIFSLQLTHLLTNHSTRKPIKQVECSATKWNNYALFNLDTYWGNMIATYDMLKKQWVGFDVTNALHIKQFAVMETQTESKLFCFTKYDEAWELYASNETEVPELRVRGMVPPETLREHKSVNLSLLFQAGTRNGTVYVTEYADDQMSVDPNLKGDYGNMYPYTYPDPRHQRPLIGTFAGIPYPVIPPVLPNNKKRIDTVTIPLNNGLKGKRLTFIIVWTNDAQLLEFQFVTNDDMSVPLRQKNTTNQTVYAPTS